MLWGREGELWYIAGNLTFDTAAYLASSFPLARHSRAGGNPVLSARKLIGQKGFLNSASCIPAVACPRVGGGGNEGSGKQRIGLS